MIGLLLAAVAACAQTETAWKTDETAHFMIHHENAASVLGDYDRIERLYGGLHDELWSLAPWMDRRKVAVFIYRDRQSYQQGRFHPPEWSAGGMTELNGEKILAIFEPFDAVVASHELTHVYMRSFFDENGVAPPAWLDEGLASMLQDKILMYRDPRDKGPVLTELMPMRQFFLTRPLIDTPAAVVSA